MEGSVEERQLFDGLVTKVAASAATTGTDRPSPNHGIFQLRAGFKRLQGMMRGC